MWEVDSAMAAGGSSGMVVSAVNSCSVCIGACSSVDDDGITISASFGLVGIASLVVVSLTCGMTML